MLLVQKTQPTNTFAEGLHQRKSLDYSPLFTSQANHSFFLGKIKQIPSQAYNGEDLSASRMTPTMTRA